MDQWPDGSAGSSETTLCKRGGAVAFWLSLTASVFFRPRLQNRSKSPGGNFPSAPAAKSRPVDDETLVIRRFDTAENGPIQVGNPVRHGWRRLFEERLCLFAVEIRAFRRCAYLGILGPALAAHLDVFLKVVAAHLDVFLKFGLQTVQSQCEGRLTEHSIST